MVAVARRDHHRVIVRAEHNVRTCEGLQLLRAPQQIAQSLNSRPGHQAPDTALAVMAALPKSPDQLDAVVGETALGAAFLGMTGHDGALVFVGLESKICLHFIFLILLCQ